MSKIVKKPLQTNQKQPLPTNPKNPTPTSHSLQLKNWKVSKLLSAENPNLYPRDTYSFTGFSRDVCCYVIFSFSFLSPQLAFFSSPGWQSSCHELWLVKKAARRQWHCSTSFIHWWFSSHSKIAQAILPLLHFHILPQHQHGLQFKRITKP